MPPKRKSAASASSDLPAKRTRRDSSDAPAAKKAETQVCLLFTRMVLIIVINWFYSRSSQSNLHYLR